LQAYSRDDHISIWYPASEIIKTLQAVIVAGMLGHSISILLNTYAHFIPTVQDQAAKLMDGILTSIPIELR
jgi:hypothetical protein